MVHEVMEAITTLPEDMVKSWPLTATSLPMARLKVASISLAKADLAAVSATKSCGRLGPEMAGTMVPMSSSSVEV